MDNKQRWGGTREGAGRPTTGRKKHQIYVTDEEYEKIKQLLADMREPIHGKLGGGKK